MNAAGFGRSRLAPGGSMRVIRREGRGSAYVSQRANASSTRTQLLMPL